VYWSITQLRRCWNVVRIGIGSILMRVGIGSIWIPLLDVNLMKYLIR